MQQEILCNNLTNNPYHGMFENASEEKNNILIQKFFSKNNVRKIQKLIKINIYKMSNYKIILEVDQDELDLFVAMKYVMSEHCLFSPKNINKQIKKLNNKLLECILPNMMIQIMQYHGYIKDINTPKQIMRHPMNVNKLNKSLLPSLTTIWEI